jgi:DNA polymerase-3 subunit delta'
MSIPRIMGHDHVFDTFRRALQQQRLASTFLFAGPAGIGKWSTAWNLAQALLCERTPRDALHACRACPSCVQVAALTHPDLLVVRKPDDKNFIPVELLIGDRERRMREGLCHDIALKPFRGGRKVAVIDDADYLNQEGANCLLKTLEEPPPDSLLILIGTSQHRQLPTIRSRCQVIRFAPLSDDEVSQLLAETQLVEDPERRAVVAARAAGSLQRAIELADPELADARHVVYEQLSQWDVDAVTLAKYVHEFVEAAGKEAPPRRARLRLVVLDSADFYRALMRRLDGVGETTDAESEPFVAAAARQWAGRATIAAACLERCLDALVQIEANANLPTLVSCWIDDLAQRTLEQA